MLIYTRLKVVDTLSFLSSLLRIVHLFLVCAINHSPHQVKSWSVMSKGYQNTVHQSFENEAGVLKGCCGYQSRKPQSEAQ